SERSFPRCDRQLEMDIASVSAIERVRLEIDGEVEIAGGRATRSGTTLLLEPDALAGGNAGRNPDVQGLAPATDIAVRIGFRKFERDRTRGATVGILDRNADGGVDVFPFHPSAGSETAEAAAARLAEQRFEEIAELSGIAEGLGTAAERILPVPVRGRLEILPGFPVGAELVVRRTLLRVLQDFVRLFHLLETRFRIRLLADVGMVFACQAPIGTLDVVLRRISLEAQYLVVVLEFHAAVAPEFRRFNVGAGSR